MKIYKLLFIASVFIGLYSCTEYLDHGMRDDGSERREVPIYEARVKNLENDVFSVGDSVFFMAELNEVDVTSTSVFRVNGVDVYREFFPKTRNLYIPKEKGEFTVVATLDDFSSTFRFTVED